MAVVVPIISTFDSKGVSRAIADFKKLDGAGKKTQFALGATSKAFSSMAGAVAKFGGIAVVAAGALARNAEVAQQADKRLTSVAKSMGIFGEQAGVVSQRLISLADAQELELGVTAETIKETQAKLLTFKNLATTADEVGGAFDRATMAALDLAATGFGSAQSNATQLGKALQDPIKGITALAKAGVTFTDSEKAKIKALVQSGNLLQAQDTLLTAIESQVKGTALATASGFDRIRMVIGFVGDEIGNVLLPAFSRLADFMVANLVPYVKNLSGIMGAEGLGGVIKKLSGDFLKATGNMGAFGNIILTVTAAMVALRLIMLAATVAQVAFNVALFSNPIGIAVAAVIAFGVAMVALAVKFKVVRDAFKEVFNFIVSYMQIQINIALGIAEFFINRFIGMINLLIKAWNAIPFTNKIPELQQVNLALDITGAKIGGLGKKAAGSAADFRKIEEAYKATAKAATGNESGTGSGGVSGAVETVADKFKKFADSARAVVSDQKNLRTALKNTSDAQKTLQTATDKVSDAQAKLNRISSGYGAGSAEASAAQTELTQAQREARQAGFDLTKATFAVTDAETALTTAREGGNAREITEAEIALEEARMALTEAQEAVTESTKAVTTAQENLNEIVSGAATTSDTYKTALQQLVEAQDAEAEAIDRVRDAKEREIETTRNLAKAEILLRKAKGKLTKKQMTAANRLLAELNTPVTVTAPTPTGSASSVSGFSGMDFSGIDFSGFSVGGLATLAEGGIVTRPTFALIGEGGESEAVIPLSKLGGMGGDVYNITINSKIADASLPDVIVGELRKFNRRSGAINIQVA
jgi:hypothetical protein